MMLPESMRKKRSFIALVFLFAVVGIAVYSQVILHGPFLFDDFEYVVDNPIIADLSPAFLMSDPRQVGYLSFALNYAMGGENPVGYHLVNVLVHIANSLLVLGVVGSLLFILNGFREPLQIHRHAAFFAALLFLVHPVQTQAVSYITQRFTSLATFFYLLAVWSYLAARTRLERDGPSRRAYALYALSLLGALLAVKTKEISFTIPAVLLLFEALVLKDSRFLSRRFLYLIPFAVTSFIIPLSLLGPGWGLIGHSAGIADITRSEKLFDLTSRPVLPYLYTQFRVVVVYVWTLLMPIRLRVVYDFPVSYRFFDIKVVASFVFLLLVAGGAVYLWRKGSSLQERPDASLAYRTVAIGIFWFFITLSVESSIIPIKDIIFEHRMYLPSVGFLMACAIVILYLSDRLLKKGGYLVTVGSAVLLIAVPLAVEAYVRNDVWTDEVKLWSDVVRKSPEKAIGYNNRGMAFARRGEYQLALEDLNKAISLFPKIVSERAKWENADINPSNMSKTYVGRGDVYSALGDSGRAREDYQRSKRLVSMPVNVDERLALANTYAKRGAYKHAIEEYNQILQWEPEQIDALNDRANAYSYIGRYTEAINDLTRVIALEPDLVLAYYNRGIALAWADKKDRAVADFEYACTKGFQPACESIEVVRRGGK